jgi:hypothetical protein
MGHDWRGSRQPALSMRVCLQDGTAVQRRPRDYARMTHTATVQSRHGAARIASIRPAICDSAPPTGEQPLPVTLLGPWNGDH